MINGNPWLFYCAKELKIHISFSKIRYYCVCVRACVCVCVRVCLSLRIRSVCFINQHSIWWKKVYLSVLFPSIYLYIINQTYSNAKIQPIKKMISPLIRVCPGYDRKLYQIKFQIWKSGSVWFGWNLWLVWFGLVWFYGISVIVGYLRSNPFNHISNI